MIAKCSEALALRRAFPQELSGLYTADEMGSALTSDEAEAPAPRLRGHIVRIDEETKPGKGGKGTYTKTSLTLDSGEVVTTLKAALRETAIAAHQDQAELEITTTPTRWGQEIVTMSRLQSGDPSDVSF